MRRLCAASRRALHLRDVAVPGQCGADTARLGHVAGARQPPGQVVHRIVDGISFTQAVPRC